MMKHKLFLLILVASVVYLVHGGHIEVATDGSEGLAKSSSKNIVSNQWLISELDLNGWSSAEEKEFCEKKLDEIFEEKTRQPPEHPDHPDPLKHLTWKVAHEIQLECQEGSHPYTDEDDYGKNCMVCGLKSGIGTFYSTCPYLCIDNCPEPVDEDWYAFATGVDIRAGGLPHFTCKYGYTESPFDCSPICHDGIWVPIDGYDGCNSIGDSCYPWGGVYEWEEEDTKFCEKKLSEIKPQIAHLDSLVYDERDEYLDIECENGYYLSRVLDDPENCFSCRGVVGLSVEELEDSFRWFGSDPEFPECRDLCIAEKCPTPVDEDWYAHFISFELDARGHPYIICEDDYKRSYCLPRCRNGKWVPENCEKPVCVPEDPEKEDCTMKAIYLINRRFDHVKSLKRHTNKIHMECDNGYYLSKEDPEDCFSCDGGGFSWSDSDPECADLCIENCPAPVDEDWYAFATGVHISAGGFANFSCRYGYVDAYRDAMWILKSIDCFPICRNGEWVSISNDCTASEGRGIVHACIDREDSYRWTEKDTKFCEKKLSEIKPQISHLKSLEWDDELNELEIECESGYILSRDKPEYCFSCEGVTGLSAEELENSFHWFGSDPAFPECRDLCTEDCPAPVDEDWFAHVSTSKFYAGMHYFTCEDGYEQPASDKCWPRCQNGEWVPDSEDCEEPVACVPMTVERQEFCEKEATDMKFELAHVKTMKWQTNKVHIECDYRYHLSREDPEDCFSCDGIDFFWFDSDPECADLCTANCPPVDEDWYARVNTLSIVAGGYTDFTCKDGYKISDACLPQCRNGEWVPDSEECEKPVTCVHAVRWRCEQDTCVACEGLGCPADISIWDDERSCMNDCPEEPECYMCQPSGGCVFLHGMACFGTENRFKTKDECQLSCATATDSGYVDEAGNWVGKYNFQGLPFNEYCPNALAEFQDFADKRVQKVQANVDQMRWSADETVGRQSGNVVFECEDGYDIKKGSDLCFICTGTKFMMLLWSYPRCRQLCEKVETTTEGPATETTDEPEATTTSTNSPATTTTNEKVTTTTTSTPGNGGGGRPIHITYITHPTNAIHFVHSESGLRMRMQQPLNYGGLSHSHNHHHHHNQLQPVAVYGYGEGQLDG